jgi:glycosyltransferase involved in cell wall biosynthesis
VSTPTGARGLEVVSDEHLVITPDDDDDEAFAAAVLALARDDGRRARMAAVARQFVVEHHDVDVVGARLASLVDQVAGAAAPNEDEA